MIASRGNLIDLVYSTPIALGVSMSSLDWGVLVVYLGRFTNGCSAVSSIQPQRKRQFVGTRECTLH